MQERSRKNNTENLESAKRRKLDDIEKKALMEEDPVKLNELYEAYEEEYLKDRVKDSGNEPKRKKTEETGRMQE